MVAEKAPVLTDHPFVGLLGQSSHQLSQVRGFVRTDGHAADVRQPVGDAERGLCAGEPGSIPDEDPRVDPAPDRGPDAAAEGAHSPYRCPVQAPGRRQGIGGIQSPGADQQAGTKHEYGRLRRGRLDQGWQGRRIPGRDAPGPAQSLSRST